jgi:hypothetical protein
MWWQEAAFGSPLLCSRRPGFSWPVCSSFRLHWPPEAPVRFALCAERKAASCPIFPVAAIVAAIAFRRFPPLSTKPTAPGKVTVHPLWPRGWRASCCLAVLLLSCYLLPLAPRGIRRLAEAPPFCGLRRQARPAVMCTTFPPSVALQKIQNSS